MLVSKPAIWRKGAEIARAETAWRAGSGLTPGVENVEAKIGRAFDRPLTQIALPERLKIEILDVDNESWRDEVELIRGHYEFIGERLPQQMADELSDLEKRLAQ